MTAFITLHYSFIHIIHLTYLPYPPADLPAYLYMYMYTCRPTYITPCIVAPWTLSWDVELAIYKLNLSVIASPTDIHIRCLLQYYAFKHQCYRKWLTSPNRMWQVTSRLISMTKRLFWNTMHSLSRIHFVTNRCHVSSIVDLTTQRQVWPDIAVQFQTVPVSIDFSFCTRKPGLDVIVKYDCVITKTLKACVLYDKLN